MIQILFSLAAYAAIGWWFIRPWLETRSLRTALSILLLPQLFRHVGISLLSPEIVDPSFPAAMALQTAIGDTLAALLAWAALISLRTGWSRALLMVWIFNLVGLADMLHNLWSGVRLQVAPHLGSAWFGIAFVVPMMLVIHLLIFVFLLRDRAASAQGPG